MRQRLREHAGRIREHGPDYLLDAPIDLVIDEGFPVLELPGEEIEAFEEELPDQPTRDSLHRLHHLKRTMLSVQCTLWPRRQVSKRLIRHEGGIISEENPVYYRDCYDHTIQILRLLTIIATMFIPLTFIVGVYGMNFANPDSPWAMLELRWYIGYPMVWLPIVAVSAGMLVYFRHKKWP